MQHALLRHLPAAIAPGRCYGRLDLPPGASGLGDPLPRGFTALALYSSPARRCMALAAAVSAETGLPVREDARLLEMDFGAWEGLPWDEVPRAALDAWAADPWGFAPPEGESGAAVVERVRAFHAMLAGPSIIVSHGGPLKILAALIAGRSIDLLAPAPPLGSCVLHGPGLAVEAEGG
ncbi:phosphoglycerate mutase family protein [Acetobacteraceae bacterium AT-5844]|nr:phosphoglycerate mutase family protein [Acetobacteraceae bacterium AT-5844]